MKQPPSASPLPVSHDMSTVEERPRPGKCDQRSVFTLLKSYICKFRGSQQGLFPPYPSFNIVLWSFVASFTGISICAALTYSVHAHMEGTIDGSHITLSFLIGSSGATAILLYGTIDSPLAQPRNLIGGHLLSAIIGVAIAEAFEAGGFSLHQNKSLAWLQCGLAVSLSLVAMQLTRTVHPPGGAVALIAVTASPSVRLHGLFIAMPVMFGVFIMLAVAIVLDNITRQYPSYWWRPVVLDIPVKEGSTHHSMRAYGEAYGRGELAVTAGELLGIEVRARYTGRVNDDLGYDQMQLTAATAALTEELEKARHELEKAQHRIISLEAQIAHS